MVFIPDDSVRFVYRRVVDANGNLAASLQLLDLRETPSIPVLIEHNRALETTEERTKRFCF